jgi:hypothetical protein
MNQLRRPYCFYLESVGLFHSVFVSYLSDYLDPFLSFIDCKTKTIPILMYQMRILANQVSSVMLKPKIRGGDV